MRSRLLHPPFVHASRDRHGHMRYYLRKRGLPRVTLPGVPYSLEFMAAYHAGLASEPAPIGALRSAKGSVSATVAGFYQSTDWSKLQPQTKATYRRLLERFRAEHADKAIDRVEARHVRQWMDDRASTPAAANAFLKMLRMLLGYATDRGICRANAADGVAKVSYTVKGFTDWSDADIAAFEAHWPTGSTPRLAMALLLYTGQRPGDVSRMGRQHLHDGGSLRLTQQKTGTRLTIPIAPALAAELGQLPSDRLIFILTAPGKPFSAAGFSAWFSQAASRAGLPSGRTAHGLRKSAARRLAEAGCTAHEIAAITGHRSLKEVAHYTRAADQARLAISGMTAVGKRYPGAG